VTVTQLTWEEKWGTAPPTKKRYIPIKRCTSFWSWFFHEWRFANTEGFYEVGRRFLGREKIKYYVIPRGWLRF
jgi:hypothetical protein